SGRSCRICRHARLRRTRRLSVPSLQFQPNAPHALRVQDACGSFYKSLAATAIPHRQGIVAFAAHKEETPARSRTIRSTTSEFSCLIYIQRLHKLPHIYFDPHRHFASASPSEGED